MATIATLSAARRAFINQFDSSSENEMAMLVHGVIFSCFSIENQKRTKRILPLTLRCVSVMSSDTPGLDINILHRSSKFGKWQHYSGKESKLRPISLVQNLKRAQIL